MIHIKTKRKLGGLLFTFVLLNRGIPDVETINIVSIEQKKRIVYRNYQVC